jgi:hypothetical protein
MITIAEYAGKWIDHKDFNTERQNNASALLRQVNLLLNAAERDGVELKTNPVTNSMLSGTQYGGFRPQSCPIGAPQSSHKLGMAIDVYDPQGLIDAWINDGILTQYQLYREAPAYTKGWCHLSTKPPKSGRRTFIP